MTRARSNILDRIRRAGGAKHTDGAGSPNLSAPLPRVPDDLANRFVEKMRASAATTATTGEAELVETVVQYLSHWKLPPRITAARAGLFRGLTWPGIDIEYRAAAPSDLVSLTLAYAGIAETGTLVLLSNAPTPTTLNFLPDHCICVLPRARIYPHMEDIWKRLRQDGEMPRTVNLIGGPSRTADVEQIIQLGAHGPRRLHVILTH